MDKACFGLIDKIQRYCIHDGAGIRTVVFMKGCEMHCPWCSNPETQERVIELARSPFKCDGCGRCVAHCPVGAIGQQYALDREKCILCGKCVRVCPKEAWAIYGQRMTPEAVWQEIEKDRPFYAKSGGGVTFSGGECTNQPAFLLEALRLCKENGVNTAIESNANAESCVMEAIVPYVDTFLLDVKHMDSEKHKKATGVGNERILGNIRDVVFRHRKPLMLRLPIIPGFNDDVENIAATVRFAAELNESGMLQCVNVLPYHAMGASKYAVLGMEYALKELQPPTDAQIEAIVHLFLQEGILAQKGG